MDQQRKAALAKRLAAYSATAGVTLAVAPEAGAQVVYHDLDPDVVVEAHNDLTEVYDLDFDDDGVVDLAFIGCDVYDGPCAAGYNRYYTYWVYFRRPDGGNAQNGVLGYEVQTYYMRPDIGAASRLSAGAVVGPADPGRDFFPIAIAATAQFGDPGGYPFTNQEGYAGFRFVAGDGQLHYGWIRISTTVDIDAEGTAYEWAYESAPDTPILAGAVSAALLDGSVNQTTFPASGGTLAYTFTVENTTDTPLPLDLWLDADGPAALTRHLGSGTLPAGATVTRTVRLRVPAGIAAGEYDVRFRLGDFSAGRFITFERYTITKEVAASAMPAGETGEPFAVEAVEGGLFAEAEAAATPPATHALSAPVPNPATGVSAVTLQVAQAQGVRVEVLDALGRQVAVLHEGPLAAGEAHRLVFDGSALPAGVYVVRAVGETFADARVLSLTR